MQQSAQQFPYKRHQRRPAAPSDGLLKHRMIMKNVNLIAAVFLTTNFASSSFEPHCDVHIESSISGAKNGNISSLNYPNQYLPNLRCIYRLTALPHERVRVEFKDFEVKGVPPRCLNDYVDVYTQVFDSSQDLLDVPLHGRFCGSGLELLPKILISMHNVFILGFYSDQQKEEKGFLASFAFIDNSIYNVGTPAPMNSCGQTIYGMSKPSGHIYSPTYPGVYPDNVFCFYRLIGVQRQRIKLTFEEIDLYSGGDHCPFDSIKVYDGPWNTSEVIEAYCGHRTNITVYSSSYNLYIQFVTKSGRIEPTKRAYVPPWDGTRTEEVSIQRRGFKASYEISAHFVDLSFIRDGKHVRGTECDQMVLSRNESTGYVISPNFPNNYPLGVVCTYYIDGLEDKQNLEKAKLVFELLDIPKSHENCSNGHLSAYLRGQTEQADLIICGSSVVPPLVSSNPRLLLVFNSLQSQHSGHGFKARFHFLTDYAIPGTPATEASKCHFIYRSTSALHGTFNSPRHPSNYPDEASCIYEFLGLQSEQIRITFETFKLENSLQIPSCSGDYVQIYNVFQMPHGRSSLHPPSSAVTHIDPRTDLLTGIYCGEVLPGPQLSEEEATSVKVLFITNSQGVNTGFKAKYEFIEKKARNKRCFYNITSGSGGQIWSPNFPHKYLINSTCEWLIISRHPGGRILLMFIFFAMERSQDKLGCGNAVLKIYSKNDGFPTHEHCGIIAKGTTVLSEGNSLRLRFVSSARAIGAKGFQLTWTEVLSVDSKGCEGFKCRGTGYCIPLELKCNKMDNCGRNDNSDESADCHTYQDGSILQISIATVGTLMLLIVVFIACFVIRKRKSLARKSKGDAGVRHNVTRKPSVSAPVCKPSHAYVGLLEGKIIKEQTEKVSIV